MKVPIGAGLKKIWIPIVLVVVLAVSGLVVSRLHKMFASQDLNAGAGAGIEIVQFNPKVMVYDVYGAPGTTAQISYFDPDANVHFITAPLPWSITKRLPAMSTIVVGPPITLKPRRCLRLSTILTSISMSSCLPARTGHRRGDQFGWLRVDYAEAVHMDSTRAAPSAIHCAYSYFPGLTLITRVAPTDIGS